MNGWRWFAIGAGLVACGGSSAATADAGPDPCAWPVDGTTPAGKVEVGTGATTFEPLGAELTLTTMWELDPGLSLDARATGLDLGSSAAGEASSPRTRFTVVAPGQSLSRCPTREPFKPTSDGAAFELRQPFAMPFDRVGLAAILDHDVAITVEVIDRLGHYASDTKMVHVIAPPGFGIDAGLPDAGALDAGALDAGVIDAGVIDAGPP